MENLPVGHCYVDGHCFVEIRPSMCLSDQAAVCVCVALSSSEFELNGRCRKADLLLVFFGLLCYMLLVYTCVCF